MENTQKPNFLEIRSGAVREANTIQGYLESAGL